MNAETRSKLEAEFSGLNSLYREGHIDANVYYKCLVALSWEWITQGEPTMAAALLNIPPVEYYTDVQPRQMEDDPDYADVAREVANKLVEEGLVELGTGLATNQSPAEA